MICIVKITCLLLIVSNNLNRKKNRTAFCLNSHHFFRGGISRLTTIQLCVMYADMAGMYNNTIVRHACWHGGNVQQYNCAARHGGNVQRYDCASCMLTWRECTTFWRIFYWKDKFDTTCLHYKCLQECCATRHFWRLVGQLVGQLVSYDNDRLILGSKTVTMVTRGSSHLYRKVIARPNTCWSYDTHQK